MRSYIFLIFMMLFMGVSCQERKMNKQYSWVGSLSAPREYPVEIYQGALKAKNFTFTFDPIWGLIAPGWGQDAGVMTVDSEGMALPTRLEMTWYSVQESCFYSGAWPLDREAIEKIWEAGYADLLSQRKGMYDKFIVGLGPKGKVVLWIAGVGQQLEVGSFRAQETLIRKDEASANAKHLFDEKYLKHIHADSALFKADLLEQLQSQGWPEPEQYNRYQQKYPWSIVLKHEDELSILSIYYHLFNGDWYSLSEAANTRGVDERALPDHVAVSWRSPEGQKSVAMAKFDFADIESIFSSFPQGTALQLYMSLSSNKKVLSLFLAGDGRQVEVKAKEVRVVHGM